VIVDEAHATALYGTRGSGRVEALGLAERVLCTVHTGGKALGVGGAWVAGDSTLIKHLVNHCRTFIYSTGPMPALAAGLIAALQMRARDGARVEALHRKAAALRARLRGAGIDLLRSESQIVPVVLGGNERALEVAAALQRDGFDVRAVRPPTVPEGTARLRVTVRAPVADADLGRFTERLIAHLGERAA
jgi:8-amino-7-oxononanoate synthase